MNTMFSHEESYTATSKCTWTYCADGTHLPTENGEYLVVNCNGNFEILDFFTEGSEIFTGIVKGNKFLPKEVIDEKMSHDFGFNTKYIATRSGFFCEGKDAMYQIRTDIYGYVKLSDINVYKISEKDGENE